MSQGGGASQEATEMRQIGLLPDAERARTFADYLYTLSIATRVESEGDGWAVWVLDEDKVPRAREELEVFRRAPTDPRYGQAARAAQALRRQEELAEQAWLNAERQVAAARTEEDSDALPEGPPSAPRAPRPVTLLLILASIGVALGSNFGENPSGELLQKLFIAPFDVKGSLIEWDSLKAITQHGEWWRLITPIFIHFGIIHLAFNMLMLAQLGGEVEERRGPWRYLLLVLLIAVLSNLAEYYCSLGFTEADVISFKPNPQFGGMSGVLYGLFGYAWMKSRFEPQLGLDVSPQMAAVLLIWFFLCLTGALGPIANVAHAVGLLLGLVIGYTPHLLRQLRQP
jgi:GlpG protein